jgi:glycosyltransferase involved in cell wall biosynthesis
MFSKDGSNDGGYKSSMTLVSSSTINNTRHSPSVSARVSVILPVLNQAKFLPNVLSALFEQETSEEIEIIVVDNGSDDGSMAIAKSYRGITVVEEREPGSYAARNQGIFQSSGEILVFLDPDCAPQPNWLSSALTALADPNIMIVLGPRLPSSPGLVHWLQCYENNKIQWVLDQQVTANVYAYTNNMATRRSLFEQHGLFGRQARGADTLFAQLIAQIYGVRSIAYAPGMVVTHLELKGVGDYLRKRIVYGKSNAGISRGSEFRSLSLRARLAILSHMIRNDAVSPWILLLLVLLLAPGSLLYDSAQFLDLANRRKS